MPLPERVQIGTYAYTVVAHRTIDREYAGLHKRHIQTIELDPSQGPDAVRDTLLHEILHAVCDNAGHDSDDAEARKLEERFVEILAPGLLGVIRDNPNLIDYLRERA